MSRASDASINLLFGMLALQIGLVEQGRLFAAFHAWTRDRSRELAEHLVARGDLDDEQRALVEAMVSLHLKKHGGDAEQSLGAIPAGQWAHESLTGLGDPELERTLTLIRFGSNGDSDNAATCAVGTATAAGQRFRVLRPHARGGLGAVFVALDVELHREVALKQILDKHADDPVSRARFVLEAEITGGLEHPGIVPVYGLGSYADGRPYYTMRLIKGDSLKQAIARFHQADPAAPRRRDRARGNLALRQLLNRFIAVCDVVAYAHSRGVLHRDLKPSNILLGPYGETLVVDWGLAKVVICDEAAGRAGAAEATLQPEPTWGSSETLPGMALGTPAYMSPEQAEGQLDRVGPASDVYSLGATLYCLLTGRPPIPDGDLAEMIGRARRGDFPRPRQVMRQVPAALEAICLKAMAPVAQDRYASPRALAQDLERWLADEPVPVYRESAATRLTRWGRRHKSAAVGIGALLVSAVLGLATGTLLLGRANERTERQRARADERARDAGEKARMLERQLYINRVNLAQRDSQDDVASAERLLDECPAELRAWEWRYLQRQVHLDLQTLRGHSASVNAVAFSPDGTRMVSGGGRPYQYPVAQDRAELILWDVATGRELVRFPALQGSVHAVAFSPDGTRIASASGSYGQPSEAEGRVTLWDARAATVLAEKTERLLNPLSVAFSPDGRLLAAGFGIWEGEHQPGRLRVWDATSGNEVLAATVPPGGVNAVAFSPDGKTIAAACSGFVQLWSVEPPRKLREIKGHTSWINGVAFSPDGKRLATAGWDKTIRLWDPATGAALLAIHQDDGHATRVAFGPDSRLLASANDDHTVRMWDSDSGTALSTFRGHQSAALDVAFGPDGRSLASASEDGTVRIWDAAPDRRSLLDGHTGMVMGVAFSPDARRVATASGDGTVGVWETATGERLLKLAGGKGWVNSAAFSPDGKLIASAGEHAAAEVWDAATGRLLRDFERLDGFVRAVAFSPDGRLLAAGTGVHDYAPNVPGSVYVWDAASFGEVLRFRGHAGRVLCVAFSPDSRLIASGGGSGEDRPDPSDEVVLWEAATGEVVHRLRGHSRRIDGLAYSHDGQWLASACEDGIVRIWNVTTGSLVRSFRGSSKTVFSVAFHPDGNRLAVGDSERMITLWNPSSGEVILTLKGHVAGVNGLEFSRDGSLLASGSFDRTARIWDASTPGGTGASVSLSQGSMAGEARKPR
jgi:WD40 repeat protein/serine/threonine protein kinase